MKAWLDVGILRCPKCKHYYLDAPWYVVEMGSDIEWGHCGTEFNTKKNGIDRAMLEFQVDKDGRIQEVKIAKHLELE